MQDFAKTTKRRPGFSVSPFASYQRKQQQRAFLTVAQKALFVFLSMATSLFLSLGILSFFFLRTASWQRTTPVSMAVLTSDQGQILKDTHIVRIDPSSKELSLLSIPSTLSVHTAQSGNYSLAALYGLYALDHETPEQFLKAFVRNVRIDTPFLVIREGRRAPTVGTLRGFLLSLVFDTKGTYVLPFADRVAVFWYALFGNARSVDIPFPQSVVASEFGLDDSAYDTFVQKNFQNTGVKKEGLSVAVVNASSITRLASTMGRLFSIFGCNILSISDTPNTQDEGVIVVADGKYMNSETVRMLSRYIGDNVKVIPETTAEYRADIVVFLGKTEATEFTP